LTRLRVLGASDEFLQFSFPVAAPYSPDVDGTQLEEGSKIRYAWTIRDAKRKDSRGSKRQRERGTGEAGSIKRKEGGWDGMGEQQRDKLQLSVKTCGRQSRVRGTA
jgi:hypothetical protein